jgi:hypothetical protein
VSPFVGSATNASAPDTHSTNRVRELLQVPAEKHTAGLGQLDRLGSASRSPASSGKMMRLPSWEKLAGYTSLCAKVDQPGERDWRRPLRMNGWKWLRWATS